jgi:hypothetical protein
VNDTTHAVARLNREVYEAGTARALDEVRALTAAAVGLLEASGSPQASRSRLVFLVNASSWEAQLGDVTHAVRELEDLVNDVATTFGRDSEITLLTECNLAAFAGLAGDAARARSELVALHQRSVEALGAASPTTRKIEDNLGSWMRSGL